MNPLHLLLAPTALLTNFLNMYIIHADSKWSMHCCYAEILLDANFIEAEIVVKLFYMFTITLILYCLK